MSQSVIQIGHFNAVKPQTMRNVLLHAPTIIWVDKGYKQLWWHEQQLKIDDQHWLIAPANQYLTFINQPLQQSFHSRAMSLLVPPPMEWLAESEHDQLHSSPQINTTDKLRWCFNMLDEMRQQSLGYNTQKQLLMAFYSELKQQDALRLLFPSAIDSLRDKMSRYLAMNPGADHKLDIVAAHFNMSRATLIRKLTAENCSFRDILAEIRMSYALGLMQQSQANPHDHSQLSLALACGYQSESRFSARFKQQFGLTPKQYQHTL